MDSRVSTLYIDQSPHACPQWTGRTVQCVMIMDSMKLARKYYANDTHYWNAYAKNTHSKIDMQQLTDI